MGLPYSEYYIDIRLMEYKLYILRCGDAGQFADYFHCYIIFTMHLKWLNEDQLALLADH